MLICRELRVSLDSRFKSVVGFGHRVRRASTIREFLLPILVNPWPQEEKGLSTWVKVVFYRGTLSVICNHNLVTQTEP